MPATDSHDVTLGRIRKWLANGDLLALECNAVPFARILLDLAESLRAVKRGDCWCEVGIDNPMMRGRHSVACARASELLNGLEGVQEVPSAT